jgi:hypothetical protein
MEAMITIINFHHHEKDNVPAGELQESSAGNSYCIETQRRLS